MTDIGFEPGVAVEITAKENRKSGFYGGVFYG